MRDEIRTILTVDDPYQYPEEIAPEPVMDVKNLSKIIESEIAQGGFDFIPRNSVPGLYPKQHQQPGLAWRKLKLSTIRGWAGLPQRTEDFDRLILPVLNSLCRRGALLVFDVRLHRDLEHTDALICCEIGHAVKDFDTGSNPPETKIVRLYTERPLSKRELSKLPAILDPKKAIEELRERRDAKFRQQFGWSNEVEIEKMLRAEDRKARLELRQQLAELIEK